MTSRLPWQKWLAIVSVVAVTFLVVWDRIVLGSAGDVTISTATTFASLDGSFGEDADGVANGVFTVNGALRIAHGGSITCNDDPPFVNNASTCDMQFNVTGNITIEAEGSLHAENRRADRSGGDITINGGGHFVMQGPTGGAAGAIILARKISGDGGTGRGGDIEIHVDGDVTVAAGAQILAASPGEAGSIGITGTVIDIDGLVSSRGSTTLGQGGPISIVALCDLTISDAGVVSSRGRGPGADLVHLEGCRVAINGLVESTGPGNANAAGRNLCNEPSRPGHQKDSTACVEVWSGATIEINGNAAHNGKINADTTLSGGTQGKGWIELFADGDVQVLGDVAGAFALSANESPVPPQYVDLPANCRGFCVDSTPDTERRGYVPVRHLENQQ